MRKSSYSCEVHAELETLWKLLVEKVEQPQTYLPGVVEARVLQNYEQGLLREVKTEGMVLKEKVVLDKQHGEVHFFMIDHPLFTGKVVNRVVPTSVQNPVAPQMLTIEVHWTPRDGEAEKIIEKTLPFQIQQEVLLLKERAEAQDHDSLHLNRPHAFGKKMRTPFPEALKKVKEELQKEGFGILTEIDVQQKFREKLHQDFRSYTILGACNPAMASQALALELDLGTLLPCNVALYAADDGSTAVLFMDPVAALSLVGNPQLVQLAWTVKEKLERVLAAL